MYDKIEDLTRDKDKLTHSNASYIEVFKENITEIDRMKKNLETYSQQNKSMADDKFLSDVQLADLKKENAILTRNIKVLNLSIEKLK